MPELLARLASGRSALVSFEPLLRRRRTVVLLFVAVAAACVPGLARLRIDNSPEGFLVPDARALEELQRLEHAFGRDRAVRLVLEGEGLWTGEGLTRLAALEQAAGDPRRVGGGVYGAAGLYHHHRWHLDAWPPDDPAGFRELARADPTNRNAGWVSRDGGTVTVLVGLFRMSPERRDETLAALEALLPPPRPSQSSAASRGETNQSSAASRGEARQSPAAPTLFGRLTGLPLVSRALDRALERMIVRTFPLLAAVALVLLLLAFRDLRSVALPLALVAVNLTVLLGAMGYAGQRLDVVVVILVPLVFVIALATGVHVLAFHRGRRHERGPAGEPPDRAVAETFRAKAWPVLWTGLTTTAGFGSLAVSPVPPVRMLGLWAGFGLAFLTLASLSFYPTLMALVLHPGAGEPSDTRRSAVVPLGRLGRRAAGWAVRRPRRVVAGFAAVGLLAAGGLGRLDTETDPLENFRPHHPVRAPIDDLEARGIGPMTASLLLTRPAGTPGSEREGFRSTRALRRLQELAAALRSEPGVFGALSAGDLVADVGGHLGLGTGGGRQGAWLAAARDRTEALPEAARMLGALVTPGGERTRVVFHTAAEGDDELRPLYRRAEELARGVFPGADAGVTGLHPLVVTAQATLLRTMILSLTLTGLVVLGAFRVLLRSAPLTLRAVVPSLWPVLLVVGTMGWIGWPVDGSTVMVAAVALGLAVDDTFHTLGHLRRTGGATAAAVVESLAATTPGHVVTSVILALGFGVCAASELVPVSRFGLLAILALAGALAADLLLVPALLAGLPEERLAAFRSGSLERV